MQRVACWAGGATDEIAQAVVVVTSNGFFTGAVLDVNCGNLVRGQRERAAADG